MRYDFHRTKLVTVDISLFRIIFIQMKYIDGDSIIFIWISIAITT